MTKQTCDPQELLKRAATGDDSLVQEMFTCFRGDLISFLKKRCGNSPDAEDALQDTFENAAKYLEGFRGETKVKNWLYRLASTACMRMRRGQKNNPQLHQTIDESKHSGLEEMGETVERMLDAKLLPLQQALEDLQTTDRAVLLLRDAEGLTAKETGVLLKLSPAGVKSRLHRARLAMKERLGPEIGALLKA